MAATKKRRGPAPAPNRAVAVVRVSTGQQVESGASLDAQRASVAAYATAMGLELVEIVEDAGVSAGIPLAQRPGGRRVLELVESGVVGAVVAPKLDRLFRDAADALVVTRDWDARGVALHVLDLRVDTASPIGRLFLAMLASFAEWERALVGQRTSAALQHLAAQGVVLGRDALGWERSDERDADGRLLLSEVADEVVTIERIRELRHSGMTFAAIASALTDEGRATKNGGRWWAATVRAVVVRAAKNPGCTNQPSRAA